MFLADWNYLQNPGRTIVKKKTHIYHTGGQMTYRALDRNRYKIASFHQNIMKFHKITQLLDHLILRVLRVRQHPDILGLSTLRELLEYIRSATMVPPLSGAAKDGGFREISALATPGT